jgi:hypothetical protein
MHQIQSQKRERSLPWRARCEMMVARGEAKDFSDAASKLAAQRKPSKRIYPDPATARLPYRDD